MRSGCSVSIKLDQNAPPECPHKDHGTLVSSGLIAGGSICGILYAVLVGTESIGPFTAIGDALPFMHGEDALGQLLGVGLFLALGLILYRAAQRTID